MTKLPLKTYGKQATKKYLGTLHPTVEQLIKWRKSWATNGNYLLLDSTNSKVDRYQALDTLGISHLACQCIYKNNICMLVFYKYEDLIMFKLKYC